MEISQSELIRDYVKEILQNQTDLSSAEKRSQAVSIFLSKHEDKKFNRNSIKTTFERILATESKKLGKNSSDFGKQTTGKKTPKFNMSSDMEAEITGGKQTLEHMGKAPAPTDGKPRLAEGESQTSFGDGVVFEADDVSAAISAFWLMMKLMYPTLELLTEPEKASLGRLWLPAFRKYLTENWKVLGIPLLASFGMLLPKIKKARDTKKESKDIKEIQEKRDSEKVGQLTCPFCNKLFERVVIEEHKVQCQAKK